MAEKGLTYYFIGIGGIGMSALAKLLFDQGNAVMGYDKTKSEITEMLVSEGIEVVYEDSIELIPQGFLKKSTQVIYTPAISKSHLQYNYFLKQGNSIKKRSVLLGELTKDSIVFAVAGTHGKTTTCALLIHLFDYAQLDFTAFLGGVMNKYEGNLIHKGSDYSIVEADEYDKSFLQLDPSFACITTMDADHLDVYGTKENLEETFVAFSKKVKKQLVVAKGIALDGITYAVDTPADYYATNIKTKDLGYTFDLVTPNGIFKEVYLNLIGIHNLSNAVASAAMAELGGLSLKSTLKAFSSFPGINRRMNVFNSAGKTIIDDYAHHPTEIKMVVDTLKERYSESKHAVIFQPHLFSRTQDFLEDFATILSEFDEVLLMDIYPARELPINGITSEVLLEKISCQNKRKILKNELVEWVDKIDANVIAVLGAGDIGNEVKKIKKLAQNEA